MRKIAAGLFVSLDGSGDDVAAKIRALKQQPGRNIGMSGSSTLVSQVPLTLTGSESFSTGVVHLSYEPAS